MTFLNPAVLFGLLAASIPIIIHLLNLRKLKIIEFSTLQFLKELQKNKIRKIKLKQWLLLALRVLIILCIVTAFARPTLVGVSIGGTTSAAKTTAVFILDDTFS
ncbi:MAG: BatA domain-containing protein, partial [Ignavibacteriaceae bacterium]|nr:BatA domain-containing protein [Ignavibacteriaceae bacterium]